MTFHRNTLRACAFLVPLSVLLACDIPVDPARAADQCEDRARAAQAPQSRVTVGANSNTGPFASGEFSISSDFIQGRDPVALYEACVFQKTGELPIRPPRLRELR